MQKVLTSNKKINPESIGPVQKKVVFKPFSPDQELLFPKNMAESIPEGHICRLIYLVINSMNIEHLIKKYKGGGTSAFHPKMMLMVWCLGFVNKIYSCRSLAKALRENITFIWISGNQTPDFRTLNNFRLRLKKEIRPIFKEIVRYALELGIIEGKDIFIDHTKKAANANKHKIVWRKQVETQSKRIDEELDKLFDYVDRLNEEEDKTFDGKDLPEMERDSFDKGKAQKIIDRINERVKNNELSREDGREARKKVRRTKELVERKKLYQEKKKILGERKSYSRTDNDAVAMRMKDKITTRPAYNEGIAVENGIVINFIISDNCSDGVSFIPLMDEAIDNLGNIPENANADGAYGNEENHSYLEEKEIGNFLKFNTYHKEKSPSWREKMMRLQDFIYNKERDEFECENKVKLKLEKEYERIMKTGYKKLTKVYRAEEGNCPNCPLRDKCTKSDARTLEVSWEGERLKEQARINLDSEKGIKLRKRRGNEVESVFGDEKMNNKRGRYVLRGMDKVNLEAALNYIAHNFKRIHKFWLEKIQNQILNETNVGFGQVLIPNPI